MKVERLELADAPIEFIDRLAGDNFFSSTSFAKLWRSVGGNPVYWVHEESGRIMAVIPGVEFGGKIFRRFQSMPNGCYARILGADTKQSESIDCSRQLAGTMLKAGYVKIFINDFYNLINHFRNYDIEQCATNLVDISSSDWEPPDSKLRQQIHKAGREGLQIEQFDASRHMNDFMNLVRLHEKRRNVKSRYNQNFFEALAELLGKDNRIQWFWCEHEKKSAASSIFFREGDSIIHWQMYYNEEVGRFHATKLIPYQVAKEAQKNGITKLNLGASPLEAEGAEFYKSKWGGKKYHYNCYVYKSLAGRLW